MLQHFLKALFGTDSVARIFLKASLYKIFALLTDLVDVTAELQRRKLDLPAFNHFDKLLIADVAGQEGHVSEEHFVEEYAESPPIERKCMAFLLYHLRCHVLLGTADRLGELTLLQVASHSEISDLNVAICSQHHVLKFQVPVNDVDFMQVAKGADDLDSIELSLLLWNK